MVGERGVPKGSRNHSTTGGSRGQILTTPAEKGGKSKQQNEAFSLCWSIGKRQPGLGAKEGLGFFPGSGFRTAKTVQ